MPTASGRRLCTRDATTAKVRKSVPPACDVGDKVRTSMGVGIVKYVFPGGTRSKIAYSVRFANRRVGVIFDEDQVTLIEKRRQGGVAIGLE